MSNIASKRVLESPPVSQRPLTLLWQHRGIGVFTAAVIASLVGYLVALTMPYGPATAVQALTVMGTSLIVGLLAGLIVRQGWVIVLTVLAYIIAVELGRLDAVGPTVDAIRLDNTFSILAFLLGRGFHSLVGLLPMLLGVILGTARTNHLAGRVAFAWRRWLGTAVLALFLLILAVLIALPATTPPILGTDGNPVVGSIAELTTITIGGHEQALMIRGYDMDKPVLLYLSGGPGQSSLPWPRVLFEELTRDFILVAWDQPGTGKSYAALSPASNMTPERVVADTVEVTNYLRERFDEEKIYLLGESWGTTLAVLAAQQRPDLYHAIISSGQMVSQRETDRRLYYDVLDYAARTGNEALAAQMEAYGEPPYQDLTAYIFVMGYYEALYTPYTLPPAYVEKGTQANLGPWNVLGSEYNLVEKVNVLRGFLDMASVLYPQLQDIDFRQDVPRLETAVYLLDGAAELSARRDLALEWYDLLEAPLKRIYTFENAAHAVAFEQFEAFQKIMVETVLPETYTNK
jgi:pimeloyl-ACP methyl ester carboxylesterase